MSMGPPWQMTRPSNVTPVPRKENLTDGTADRAAPLFEGGQLEQPIVDYRANYSANALERKYGVAGSSRANTTTARNWTSVTIHSERS